MYKHSWGAATLDGDHFEQHCATCPSKRIVYYEYTTVLKAHSSHTNKTSLKNARKLGAMIRYPGGYHPQP